MKREKKLKIKIRMKEQSPLTIHIEELKRNCWDSILKLEKQNPQTLEEFGDCELLDNLMQNYFTWKMIFRKYNSEITDEMGSIEDFIGKHLKSFHTALIV